MANKKTRKKNSTTSKSKRSYTTTPKKSNITYSSHSSTKYTKKTKRKINSKIITIGILSLSIIILIICCILGLRFKKIIKIGLIIFIIDIIYLFARSIIKGRKLDPVLRKKRRKKHLLIFLLVFISGIIVSTIFGIIFYFYIASNAPDFDPQALYVSEPSVLYDANGNEFAKLGAEKRVIVSYEDLPEVLIDAIVATEDSKFFAHNGVDWARFLKASAQQLIGRDVSGASTLTMQISKNAYTSKESSGIKGIIRKFTDVYISTSKIEPKYSKEEIMEFYVNSYFLGNNSYGVEQASLTYFGKSTKDLNLAEAAMIAGLFQAPGKYNPYTNPKATEERRQQVLYYMKRHGYINEQEYKIAKEMTVEKIVKPKNTNANGEVISDNKYQVFIDLVANDVEETTGNNPYTMSMEIYTTLNPEKQDYLNGITDGTNYQWENEYVQTGVAAIDMKTGAIIAVSGGRNYAPMGLNRATDLKNQIGSTAKPLYDYGPAIEYNNWSTYQTLVDEPSSYSNGVPIHNWDGGYKGYMTMREALAQSRNIPALKTFKKNNKENVSNFVKSLGLHPEEGLHEAHAIGGYNGESPLSMAAAYAAFGNGGYYIKPYSFTKIVYKDTEEEFENQVEKTKAMSEETAYMISDMLVTTGQQAMGRYNNINGVQYAAKTGTTNFDEKKKEAMGLANTNAVNDYWVVGFNTEYAVAMWYGYDIPSKEHHNDLMSAQHERLYQAIGKGFYTSSNTFTMPAGVSRVEVELECPEANLPSEYTPSNLRRTELFVKGTEPTNQSKRFAKLQDVSNVNATNVDKVVTITWNSATNPEINSESYLRNYYRPVFENDGYLNSFVSNRLAYNASTLGEFGYDVYRKENSGTLTHLGFTKDNKFSVEVKESGTYTYVIKTTYSNFKSNASDGKSVSLKVTIAKQEEKDTTKDKDTDKDKDTNKDQNTNTNNNNNNNNDNNNNTDNKENGN